MFARKSKWLSARYILSQFATTRVAQMISTVFSKYNRKDKQEEIFKRNIKKRKKIKEQRKKEKLK